MNKLTLTILLCLSCAEIAVANKITTKPINPAIKPTSTKAAPANKTELPLNSYGAIDVNADVPFEVQVPKAPADFKAPIIDPLTGQFTDHVPTPPTLDVKSYLLMDAKSGKIIAAYNANTRQPPASLTKLMLVYLAEKNLSNGEIKLSDTITVPKVAWATGGSRMFLKPGEKVTVGELMPGIVTASGNDAAVTLATYLAGSQNSFVSMMNQETAKLGMTNTHFSDVMGLPAPNHYSSAHDLGMLGSAIVNQYPQYLTWFNQKYFKHAGIKQANFNKLLFMYKYAQDLKTGSTDDAGYSLVSAAHMPKRPMELIGVILGAQNSHASATDSKALLTYGFRFFKTKLLYAGGTSMQKAKVYLGDSDTVPVGLQKDLYITYPSNLDSKLKTTVKINKEIKAPLANGEKVGEISVTVNGKPVADEAIVTLKAVKSGGWWHNLWDHLSLWF